MSFTVPEDLPMDCPCNASMPLSAVMDDMFGMQYSISIESQPYPVLCTLSPDGCTAHVPDFPKIEVRTPTLDSALLEVKQQIEKALRQYKNPPIPTKQEQIVVPTNSVLVLVKAG